VLLAGYPAIHAERRILAKLGHAGAQLPETGAQHHAAVSGD
jgi:hypothetical protein